MTSGSHKETEIEMWALKVMISASDGEDGDGMMLLVDMLLGFGV